MISWNKYEKEVISLCSCSHDRILHEYINKGPGIHTRTRATPARLQQGCAPAPHSPALHTHGPHSARPTHGPRAQPSPIPREVPGSWPGAVPVLPTALLPA